MTSGSAQADEILAKTPGYYDALDAKGFLVCRLILTLVLFQLQSIKFLSRRHNMSTLEMQEISSLKGKVARLEARLEFLYKHLGVSFVEDLQAGNDPKVIAALSSNTMIEAIKAYRERYGVGLAEAKNAVEEMRTRLGI
jgi:ribosomal protein L7/L12